MREQCSEGNRSIDILCWPKGLKQGGPCNCSPGTAGPSYPVLASSLNCSTSVIIPVCFFLNEDYNNDKYSCYSAYASSVFAYACCLIIGRKEENKCK